MMRWTLLLWAALASVAMAAQEDAAIKAIAPYVGDQTVAVVHIDTAGIDVASVQKAALDLMKPLKLSEAETAEATKQISAAAEAGTAWLRQFRAAGGRHLYLVIALTDPPVSPGVLIAPIEQAGNAESLAKLLRVIDAARVVQARDGAVLLADNRVIDRAVAQGGKARPQLVEALAAVEAFPARMAFIPTEDMRRVVEALQPPLPKELGGAPATTVTRGLLWASIGVQADPQPLGRIIIQSRDEASAKAMRGVLSAGLDSLAATLDLEDRKTEPMKLLPQQENARIVLQVGRDELAAMAKLVEPPLAQARERARRVMSASNIRQILMGIHLFANDHKGAWPDDLQTLAKAVELPKNVLVNPRRPAGPGYVYIKPATPLNKTGGDVILVHETVEGAVNGVNVGFADGHVEWHTLESFEETMARQKAAGK